MKLKVPCVAIGWTTLFFFHWKAKIGVVPPGGCRNVLISMLGRSVVTALGQMFTSFYTVHVVARVSEAFERLSVQTIPTTATHPYLWWSRHEPLLCLESPVDTKHEELFL